MESSHDDVNDASVTDPLRGSQSKENIHNSQEQLTDSKRNSRISMENNRNSKNLSTENVSHSRKNSTSQISRHSSIDGGRQSRGSEQDDKKLKKKETRVRINSIDVHDRAVIEDIANPGEAAFSWGNKPKIVSFELEDYDPDSQDKCTKCVEKISRAIRLNFRKFKHILLRGFLVLLLILYIVYFIYAIYHNADGATVLIVMTSLIVFYLLFQQAWRLWGDAIYKHSCGPIGKIFDAPWWKYCRWGIYGCIALALILFLIFDVGADIKRLTSALGMVIFIFIAFLTSTHPHRVKWRPVLWGIGLQFVLGVLILRWNAGYHFFRFVGNQVKVFLDYTDEGSKFVFGEEGYLLHRMAFKVFPIVIYFSAVISILYYWGLVQFIVCKIAKVMQYTMGTTAIESLNAAANIFIGMAESCVIMRPFIHKLTKSELHAVMTGGFATVAGSYIALLVEVGASPEHLLSAAIMSAPAALAMAKLSYPEMEISHTKTEEDVYMEKTPARNVVEAASNGAIAAIKVVASVAANLIAIMGLIAFLDAMLSYFGEKVGVEGFNFQAICSVVFWPIAALMGVDIKDAGSVAGLLGTKVIVDEFLSFRDLGILMEKGAITDRSSVIATYACCGFGSIAAVGIYIGALVSVAPQRRGDISEVALRAVVNGNLAGFLTACIAGVLYTGESLFHQGMVSGGNETLAGVTLALTEATLSP